MKLILQYKHLLLIHLLVFMALLGLGSAISTYAANCASSVLVTCHCGEKYCPDDGCSICGTNTCPADIDCGYCKKCGLCTCVYDICPICTSKYWYVGDITDPPSYGNPGVCDNCRIECANPECENKTSITILQYEELDEDQYPFVVCDACTAKRCDCTGCDTVIYIENDPDLEDQTSFCDVCKDDNKDCSCDHCNADLHINTYIDCFCDTCKAGLYHDEAYYEEGGYCTTCGATFPTYYSEYSSSSYQKYIESVDAPQESSGSEGRKIAISGVPLPSKSSGESDYEPEQTYVDALSLNLQHNVTDIFVPIGTDQFALQVRRNLCQETFSDQIDDDMEYSSSRKAFGGCWNSNLDCRMKIVTAFSFLDGEIVAVSAGYRTIATVTDENGSSYRFALVENDDGEEEFLALPSGMSDVEVSTQSLELQSGYYVFKRKYGTEVYFDSQMAMLEGDSIELGTDSSAGCSCTTINSSTFCVVEDKMRKFSTADLTTTAGETALQELMNAGIYSGEQQTEDSDYLSSNCWVKVAGIYYAKINGSIQSAYANQALMRQANCLRIIGEDSNEVVNETQQEYEEREYYRPVSVLDRYGYTLAYEYSEELSDTPGTNNASIIPCRISVVNPGETLATNPVVCIEIELENDHVSTVRDPIGNEISFAYTNGVEGGSIPRDGIVLSSASRGDASLPSVTQYAYQVQQYESLKSQYVTTVWQYTDDDGDITEEPEETTSVTNTVIYTHLVLNNLEDANGNDYAFSWDENSSQPGSITWCEEGVTEDGGYDTAKGGEWGPEESDDYLNRTTVDVDVSGYALQLQSIASDFGTVTFSVSGPYDENEDIRETVVEDLEGHEWTYEFSNPVVEDNLDRPFLGTVEYESESQNENSSVYFQQLAVIDENGGEQVFVFDLDAGMALERKIDCSSNITSYSHTDKADYDWLGSSSNAEYMIELLPVYMRRTTAQTNALGGVRSYTYETNWNQQASITDELLRYTKFTFDPETGMRTHALKYDEAGTLLSETVMEYSDSAFPNFMTKQTQLDLDDSDDPGWVADLTTTFTPHEYGKVGTKTVTVDGVALTTTYAYDKNNNLTYVLDPNSNATVNVYDSQNRLTKICFYDGSDTNGAAACEKEFWYDLRGNKTWEKDENEHYSFFQYDSRNHVTNTVRVMNYDSFVAPTSGLDGHTVHDDDISVSSTYNALGMLETTTDARGLVTRFQYDHLQRLTNSVVGWGSSPVLLVTKYEYGDNCGGSVFNSSGFKPTKVTDPRGYVSETDYDALYRTVETRAQVEEDGALETLATMGYDAVGNLRFTTNWVDGTEFLVSETQYDDLNRPTKVINALGTDDETYSESWYTSTGLKWKSSAPMRTDGTGEPRYTLVEYDLAGRPTDTQLPAVTNPKTGLSENPTTTVTYDANGNVKTAKDANDNVTTTYYDYRNRPSMVVLPEVSVYEDSDAHPVTGTAYDNVGNALFVTNALNQVTEYQYDCNNRLIVTIAPAVDVYGESGPIQPTTTNFYDKAGNITSTVDANSNTVQMRYDDFGRLYLTIDAESNEIEFGYDNNGNQTALEDGKDNRTEFTYDGLNRKTLTTYPSVTDHGVTYEQAVYDLIGNRTKRIDCNQMASTESDWTSYEYDALNRLDLVTYVDGDSFTTDRTRDYTYDDYGNLESVEELEDTNANVSYGYDALGRVTSETSVGVPHAYAYDLNGNRLTADYGLTGRHVAWTYDALNRIETIVEKEGTAATSSNTTTYAYDLNSQPVYRQYPSGTREYRYFDAMGRLTTMATEDGQYYSGFVMYYQYDAVGSAMEMEQDSWCLDGQAQDATTTWSYDDRYRLTNETIVVEGGNTTETSYMWDDADNRESKKVYEIDGETSRLVHDMGYVYNALNQLKTIDDTVAEEYFGYQYDANGARVYKNAYNMLTDVTVITTYDYDEDNRLTEVCVDSTTPTHEFAYDYRSRRYYRGTPESDGSTKHMYCVFDGGLSIQEYTVPQALSLPSSATLTTEFIRGEGMGGGVGGMVYSIKGGGTANEDIICSHANHRGDVIARTDSSGSLTSFALYEAYGTRPYEWPEDGSGDPDRQKANTKEEETDLGLLNEGMRFRDLETGVFLTRDPIGYGDGPNMYCYVHCNPITRFDPLGLTVDYTTLPKNDLAVLNELRSQDPVFNAQMEILEKSDHSFNFDDGKADKKVLMFEGKETDGKNGVDDIQTIKDGGDYTPKFSADSSDANKTKDGPGKGSGGTISWSASENGKTKDGEYDPKTVLAHETQHAVDANAGVRDETPSETGVPIKEERAVRRQNESQQITNPDAPLRETYENEEVKDHDVPLPDPTPEPESDGD
jgi:RHS repeat-associated protein